VGVASVIVLHIARRNPAR